MSSPPPPSKSPRPKPIRRTSLKKKNSHAPAPSTDSLPPLQLDNLVGNGKQEEARPARRKSVIRRVLDKRRERVEAGNNYYNSYILQANGGGERQEYDPMLGVENLPLRQYSGLHIGSPSQLLVDGGTGDRREGRSELGGEEIGVAVSGDEAEERREKRKGREGAETMRGGYWGNFPSHSYGGSYGGLSGVRYVGEHGGGDYGDSTSHGNDHGGYSGGDHDGNGGDGGGGDGGAGGAE